MSAQTPPSSQFPPLRRKDRGVSDLAWIEDFLRRAPVGVLATALDNQPYAKPSLFVFDADRHAIFLHFSDQGHTFHTLQQNARVVFTVYEMGQLIPAQTAREFGVEYASVVVYGQARLLAEVEEQKSALQLLLDKYFPDHHPGRDYPPIRTSELGGTAVVCIEIEHWTGKQKKSTG